MNEAKNYTISVLHDQYVLKTDESKERVEKSAELIDAIMQEIVKKNKHIDNKRAAVLAALRVASQFVRLQEEYETMQLKGQELIDTIDQHLSNNL